MNEFERERLTVMYPKGCRIELIEMENNLVPKGTRGTVAHTIRDDGTIEINWDTKEKGYVYYPADKIRFLSNAEIAAEKQKC